jgi:hypothetical protein
MYIGRNNIYGLFEKQEIVPSPNHLEYTLRWRVGSGSSILVIVGNSNFPPAPWPAGGQILNSGIDYNVVDGGRTIRFSQVPGPGTYILYIGRELAVPRTVGIEPKLDRFTGNGSNKDFHLSMGPVDGDAVIVFVNGVQKKLDDPEADPVMVGDFTLEPGEILRFKTAPANNADISVYIHGVERFDLPAHIADGSITTEKIADDAVTFEKLGLVWVSYSPAFTPLPAGTISQTLRRAAYMRITEEHTRLKLYSHVYVSAGSPAGLRFSIPTLPNINGHNSILADDIISGSVTLASSNSIIETGILTWASDTQLDVQRQNGIGFPVGTSWYIKLRADIDLV